jgi:sugar (pentulose or hexulose) kinase
MMNGTPVLAVFDVGKTNKKLLLFNEQYQVVYEQSDLLPETADEDGFPCEDIHLLTKWVRDAFSRVKADHRFWIKAINFSGYGASFVLLDDHGKIAAPLYNYLKPYPTALQEQFYHAYGGQSLLCRQTASPALGSLNSGLQLYRIKHEKPALFQRVKVALHLPQYLCYMLSGNCVSEITSIGCHTHLWDFEQHRYHDWVRKEGIQEKMAPLQACGSLAGITSDGIALGVGLHDSSAALIPYLRSFREPFVLLSTGTWSISLNPFNSAPLTDEELKMDCLCYLSYEGKQVKASRLFAGQIHAQFCRELSEQFGKGNDYYKQVAFDEALLMQAGSNGTDKILEAMNAAQSFEQAYHQRMDALVDEQVVKLNLVLKDAMVEQIFVDGGFAQNPVFMHLLARRLPGISVHAASMAQASSLGAAMAISNYGFPFEAVQVMTTSWYK